MNPDQTPHQCQGGTASATVPPVARGCHASRPLGRSPAQGCFPLHTPVAQNKRKRAGAPCTAEPTREAHGGTVFFLPCCAPQRLPHPLPSLGLATAGQNNAQAPRGRRWAVWHHPPVGHTWTRCGATRARALWPMPFAVGAADLSRRTRRGAQQSRRGRSGTGGSSRTRGQSGRNAVLVGVHQAPPRGGGVGARLPARGEREGAATRPTPNRPTSQHPRVRCGRPLRGRAPPLPLCIWDVY